MPGRDELTDEALENKLKYYQRTKTDLNIDYNLKEREAFESKQEISPQKLGNGSQGDVFEVKSKLGATETFVVKKFKAKDVQNREMSLEQFLGMIELLRKHPNDQIVRITDRLQQFDGFLYMLMEKIGQYNLYEFKRHQNTSCMSQRTGKYIFEQMVMVTKYLNDIGLIHRDIKTKNFVVHNQTHFEDKHHNVAAQLNKNNCLDARIQVKLVDFDFLDQFKLSKHNTQIGTRPYVSPQNFNRQLQSEKSDIFSIGMMYYFLLTGNQPVDKDELRVEFSSKDAMEKRLRHDLGKKIMEPWTKSILYCLMRYEEIDRCDVNRIMKNKSFNDETHVL